MSLQLRQAKQEDALAVAHVKDAIWPEEATSPEYIAQVLQQPDHCTILAIYEAEVVGFVDGFLTLGADRQRRWEVDLLGVQPAYQGQGIGSHLIQATTQAGREMAAEMARGLVATMNVGSQKAFRRGGYAVGERPFNLWISSLSNPQLPILNDSLPMTSYLLPVITLNYQGVWLEGELSAASMGAAQAICARMGWAVTGMLIDVAENELNEIAQGAGYVFINQFQWWQQAL